MVGWEHLSSLQSCSTPSFRFICHAKYGNRLTPWWASFSCARSDCSTNRTTRNLQTKSSTATRNERSYPSGTIALFRADVIPDLAANPACAAAFFRLDKLGSVPDPVFFGSSFPQSRRGGGGPFTATWGGDGPSRVFLLKGWHRRAKFKPVRLRSDKG